jgi:gas vesicle protein
MADRDTNATVGALLLVAGGVIGAGMALLFAPQTGKRTRRQIVRYGRKVRNDAEEMIRETSQTVSDALEDLGERTSELIEHGGDVAHTWRKRFLDTLDHSQKTIEKQRKRLAQLWE